MILRPIEAPDEAAAGMALQAQGLTVLGLEQGASQGGQTQRAAPWEVAWWCRELRTLLRSGMTVVEAIDTMGLSAEPHSTRAEVQQTLLGYLQQGQGLSQAMLSCGRFPAVLVASVTAAERSSKLVEALDDYLRYDELLERLRRQVVSAAIYPALVVGLGGLITLFLLGFVIPRFSRIYADMPQEISGLTQAVLWLSGALQAQGWWLAVAAALSAFGLGWAARQGLLKHWLLAAVSRVPWLAQEWGQFGLARLYHALALMFRGGYPLSEALQVCEGLGLSPDLQRGVALARLEIAKGCAVAQAFAHAGLADAVTQRLLAVGERAGGFDTVLQTVADRHALRFTTFVERATRIAEPLLLLLVALVVGGVVVMMYMPIFDMAGQVGVGR
ncbi:type II secretion system F family protein [Ideonella paludis]|uniref:type II secretion system F family protein n=2 Tax=Ideonella paludis TaxID=1233411 RepID=UPI001B359D8B|nr:type II secretion system F family protein [Ideonella paludis]